MRGRKSSDFPIFKRGSHFRSPSSFGVTIRVSGFMRLLLVFEMLIFEVLVLRVLLVCLKNVEMLLGCFDDFVVVVLSLLICTHVNMGANQQIEKSNNKHSNRT